MRKAIVVLAVLLITFLALPGASAHPDDPGFPPDSAGVTWQ